MDEKMTSVLLILACFSVGNITAGPIEHLLSNSTDDGNDTLDLSMIEIMPIFNGSDNEWMVMNLTEKADEDEDEIIDISIPSTSEIPAETSTLLPTTEKTRRPDMTPIKRFMKKESMTVSRTNAEGITTCYTFYRHTASDDYSHAGICTAGNCYDDPDFINCRDHFPEKFMHDNPFFV